LNGDREIAMSGRIAKQRLDLLLVARGLAPSRQRAQAMLLAGDVMVNGQRAGKPGSLIAEDVAITIAGDSQRYSSRGGLKLEGALADFGISPAGCVCLDAGSSTGGFTDCLLAHGAAKVFALDVNTAQLDWKLLKDSRVVPIKCNVRYLKPAEIPEPIDFVTADVSFISVTKVLPALVAVARAGAEFLILIKPQFELQKRDIGKGGIVRDVALHELAIEKVRAFAAANGLEIAGVLPSHLAGAEGNLEYFLHARRKG
jgi:23S rRNA (cytidine1920-2'-O)/16S rRNA (cytidine1409-2'-O)-methyltransferase